MKKYLKSHIGNIAAILTFCILVPLTVYAAVPIVQRYVFRGGVDVVSPMIVTDTITHSGTLTQTGTLNASGTLQIGGTAVTASAAELNLIDASANYSSASVTNGEAVTLSASVGTYWITGIGGADDSTNTITLALPYPVGSQWTIVVDSATTNLIKIADSTTVVALGSDWVADGTDTIVLYAKGTNQLYKICSSNN